MLAPRLLALLAAVCLCTGFAADAVARAPAAVSVDLAPQRVSDRVWYVQGDSGMVSLQNEGFNSNAGFVVTDDGVVVFDALGTPALGAALLERIRSVTKQPVRRVVVSHYHSDHFYGLQAFKEAGADVWAHRAVRDYLATGADEERLAERRVSLAPWVTDEARIVAPDHYVDGETVFRLGGLTFRLLPAGPAHTTEDLMMLVEEEGVLFAGDALADLALTRDYLLFLRAEMGKAVDELLDFDEAYQRTDWSRFSSLPAFDDANRRNAYNVFLRMQREALGVR